MAGNIEGQIRKLNKAIDALALKASKIKDNNVKEGCAFHAGLMVSKASALSRAFKSTAIFNRLSSHHTPAKKGKRK